MMKKYFLLMLIAFPLTCFFTACGNDDDDEREVVAGNKERYIVVANEDGVDIYYRCNDNGTELAVEHYSRQSNLYDGNVVVPQSVTYNGKTYSVTSIGERAFEACRGLTSITIPNSVTIIENKAFWGCSGLTSITIPNSVTSIGWLAFDGTAWYDNQPDGVVYAGKVAYDYKAYISTIPTRIVIKEGTLAIADEAFYGRSMTSIIIPNSVTNIGNKAFKRCESLTSVTIPNSVTSIGGAAFDSCEGLTNVTIGNSVTSIGDCAFQDCSGLTRITIPNSVTSIGNAAFEYCI